MQVLAPGSTSIFALGMTGALVAGTITLAIVRIIVGARGTPVERAALLETLHPTDLAYLARGLECAIEAAVAGLAHDPGAVDLAHVERHVRATLNETPGASVRWVVDTGDYLEAPLRERLTRAGLLVTSTRLRRAALHAPGLLWLGGGVAWLGLGVSGGEAIGLMTYMILVGVTMLAALRLPRRTARGAALLRDLDRRARRLRVLVRSDASKLSRAEIELAYACFGPAILAPSLAARMPSYRRELTVRDTPYPPVRWTFGGP